MQVEFNREFLEISGNQITIGVKSKPVNGQANKEILKSLSKYFGISSKQILIKSGHRSTKKLLRFKKR
ncbi:MAG: DUF167 domain-containing protein [Nitrosopumilaceae archaeon]|nr:DUF167 domain-containing protein [Nitrosopumilaceae archaeon]